MSRIEVVYVDGDIEKLTMKQSSKGPVKIEIAKGKKLAEIEGGLSHVDTYIYKVSGHSHFKLKDAWDNASVYDKFGIYEILDNFYEFREEDGYEFDRKNARWLKLDKQISL